MNRSLVLILTGALLGTALGLTGHYLCKTVPPQALNEVLSGYGASVTTCERNGLSTWTCAVVKPTHATICTDDGCSPLAPVK